MSFWVLPRRTASLVANGSVSVLVLHRKISQISSVAPRCTTSHDAMMIGKTLKLAEPLVVCSATISVLPQKGDETKMRSTSKNLEPVLASVYRDE